MRAIKLDVLCAAFLSLISLASSQGILTNFLDVKFEIENQQQPRLLQATNQLPSCQPETCLIKYLEYDPDIVTLAPYFRYFIITMIERQEYLSIKYNSSIDHQKIITRAFLCSTGGQMEILKEYYLPQGSPWTKEISRNEVIPQSYLLFYMENNTPYTATITLDTNSLGRFFLFDFLPNLLQNPLPLCRSLDKCLLEEMRYQSSTLVLPPGSQRFFRTFLSSEEDMERDLVIQYSSSIQHPDISTKIFVRPSVYNVVFKEYDLPQGSSWTRVIPKDKLVANVRLVFYFDNDTPYSTTISLNINLSGLFPPPMDIEGYDFLSLILFGVAAIIFLVAFFACMYCWYRKNTIRRHAANMVYNMQEPAQPGVLAQEEGPLTMQNLTLLFPEKNFGDLKSSFPQARCSICLEELVIDQSCRQLYCEHIFHAECLKSWLVNQLVKGHAFCPNCRTDVMQKHKKNLIYPI